MNRRLSLALAATGALAATSAQAELVGFDDGNFFNAISYTESVDASTWGPGDWFGRASYNAFPNPNGLPFAIADDSVGNVSGSGPFPPDDQGIIESTYLGDVFFSLTDTVNPLNPSGDVSATWVFDIAGFTDLSISMDFAAMGDFESSDVFLFSYSIDGSPATTFFEFIAEEALSQTYTMESGLSVTLNDPLSLGGTLLDDVLRTFTAALPGEGSLLEIGFFGNTNGGDEAFVFDSMFIEGTRISEPGIILLFGSGLLGLALSRRRRS